MVKIYYYLLALFVLIVNPKLLAQSYTMPINGSNMNIVTCSGNFYDSGGAGGNFSGNESGSVTFCPATPGTKVKITFTAFDIGSFAQTPFVIYDGIDDSAPIIDQGWDQVLNGLSFEPSTVNGCITFKFTSTTGISKAGWAASVECYTPCTPPVAAITLTGANTSTKICPGNPIYFSGLTSTATAPFVVADYEWKFGDGTIGNGSTITHTYDTTGGRYSFFAELKVKDNNNCYNSNAERIEIQISPNIIFPGTVADDNSICLGDQAHITGLAVQLEGTPQLPPPVNNTTYLPDGSGTCYEPTISYSQFVQGATLTSVSDIVNVYASLEHTYIGDLYIDLICPNGQSAAIYNATHTFCGNGTNGQFFGNPDQADGTGPGTGFVYTWDPNAVSTIAATVATNGITFNNSVPAGTYAPEGTLTSLVGCPLNGTWTLRICDTHSQDDGYCFQFGMNFNANLFGGVVKPNIVSSQWAADPTITANVNNVITVKPTTPGSKTYTFSATNDFGCTYDTTVTIYVNPLPVDTFTYTKVCVGDSTKFNNLSTVAGGTIKKYDWKFTTGSNPPSSSIEDPSYLYATCGNYVATLIVTTDSGCISVYSSPVDVDCAPTADFSAANVCETNTANFINNTNGATNYQWDFETVGTTIDNTSNAQNPQNVYTSDGTYLVSLIASNNGACKDTVQKSITIYPVPIVSFTAPNVCFNDSTFFASSATVDNPDNITSYIWDFNNDNVPDITSSTNANPHIKYTTVYKDSASLTVITNNGCIAIAKEKILIYDLPIAAFSAPNVCLGEDTKFLNQSSIASGNSIANYKWDLVTTTSTTKNPTVQYITDTSYTVTLIAKSNYGCSDTVSHLVKVYPLPRVDFMADILKGCEPICINFYDGSSIKTNVTQTSNVAYDWQFGTGDISGVQNPEYCFNKDGLFSVQLKVTSDLGCKDSLKKQSYIEVYPKPTANFSATPIKSTINDPIVTVVDSSILATLIDWNFGDNNLWVSSTDLQQNYNYKDTGTYVITQIVSSLMGCKDTFAVQIYMGPNWGIYIPNAFTPNGDGKNDVFNMKMYGIKTYDLLVFNRWGEVVSKISNTNTAGWDGTDLKTGTMSQQDVYNWQLEYTNVLNQRGKKVGQVTLIK